MIFKQKMNTSEETCLKLKTYLKTSKMKTILLIQEVIDNLILFLVNQQK